MLRAHDLAIGYDGTPLAKGLTLAIEAGQLICLLGPNGVGKSTLIRTLTGMQTPLAGEIMLNGTPIAAMDGQQRALHLAVVLTERVNAPSLTAYELVSIGRHPHTGWLGRLSDKDHAIVKEALRSVGAMALAHQPISALSDGQRQKVMIARGLAQQPSLFVLDEPTAYLDVPHRVEVMQILRNTAHQSSRAVLLSTHDLDLALRHADIIWLMMGSGRIVIGAPEDLVLQGAFSAAFDRGGVAFNPDTGSFSVTETTRHAISVQGEGRSALWAARALIRAGYTIEDGAAVTVEAMDDAWRIIHGSHPPQTTSSIAEMLAVIQST